ncbi:hypothetical protein C8J56DRAFT_742549, partial [Mycena floridula]
FTWGGQPSAIINVEDGEVVKEILWELYELGFHQELLALNQRACINPPLTSTFNKSAVQQCLVIREGDLILSVSFEKVDQGLAAASCWDRAPYLIQLLQIMLEWKGGQDMLSVYAGIVEAKEMTSEAEEGIVVFYAQSFFDCFGRPPTIPH